MVTASLEKNCKINHWWTIIKTSINWINILNIFFIKKKKKYLVIIFLILSFILLDKLFFQNYNESIIQQYNIVERYDNENSDLAKNISHRTLRFKSKDLEFYRHRASPTHLLHYSERIKGIEDDKSINVSLSFLQILEGVESGHVNDPNNIKNIISLSARINKIPNPHAVYLTLKFQHHGARNSFDDMILLNFNCYLVRPHTARQLPKLQKLLKEMKANCDQLQTGGILPFHMERDNMIFTELRNTASNFFYISHQAFEKIQKIYRTDCGSGPPHRGRKKLCNWITSYVLNVNDTEFEYSFDKKEQELLKEFFGDS